MNRRFKTKEIACSWFIL